MCCQRFPRKAPHSRKTVINAFLSSFSRILSIISYSVLPVPLTSPFLNIKPSSLISFDLMYTNPPLDAAQIINAYTRYRRVRYDVSYLPFPPLPPSPFSACQLYITTSFLP